MEANTFQVVTFSKCTSTEELTTWSWREPLFSQKKMGIHLEMTTTNKHTYLKLKRFMGKNKGAHKAIREGISEAWSVVIMWMGEKKKNAF